VSLGSGLLASTNSLLKLSSVSSGCRGENTCHSAGGAKLATLAGNAAAAATGTGCGRAAGGIGLAAAGTRSGIPPAGAAAAAAAEVLLLLLEVLLLLLKGHAAED
jgi:hypothetical protein